MTEPQAAAENDVWTVQRILQWTTGFLEGKGVESPRLEAELLLAHARGCQRIHLYTSLDMELTAEERAAMRGFVKRRAAREPLAYITGTKEFYGREFYVGQGVLVPRPETETLIDVCLDFLPKDQESTIAEVGFGSGCISITLAKQRLGLNVIAGDISDDALSFAKKNGEKQDVQNRIQWLLADGITELNLPSDQPIAGIVSNPPYIRNDEFAGLEPEVRLHEPETALTSGTDGLDLVRRLISEAATVLKPNGWMALEVDPMQCSSVEGLFQEAGFSSSKVHQDLSGNDRIVSAVR
ncbi:MAG: peptide chain release factor N(5)-glutamine methyltransferase [Fuerstiella sp.]